MAAISGLPILKGLQADYDAMIPDANTLYVCTDTKRLYHGATLLGDDYFVASEDVRKIVRLSYAEYMALPVKDPETHYVTYDDPNDGTPVAWVPNYSRMESTNRLVDESDTWTVDRDGFVRIGAVISGAQGGVLVRVNNSIITRVPTTGIGSAPATLVMAVSKGDVLKVEASGGTFSAGRCYYIPPKVALPPLSNDYSTTEQLTGGKWIDGKPIYKRVFTGTITAAANAVSYTDLDISGTVSEIVNYGGYICADNTTATKFSVNGTHGAITSQTVVSSIYTNAQNYLRASSSSTAARTNAPYRIWVEYTRI